jgi:hypothetical protein
MMALKRRVNFNVDRLRLCYRQPQQLFTDVTSCDNDTEIDCGDFRLKIVDNGGTADDEQQPTNATAQILYRDGDKDVTFGNLELNNSAKYSGKCFLSLNNQALYDNQGIDMRTGEKYNHLCYLPYITSTLGLVLNNITLLEIAADTNVNPVPSIRRYIHDYEHYDMIMNGKRVADERRKIDGYCEAYGSSRVRIDRYPTLYFGQSKAEGLRMRIYNKTKEIEEASGKQYEADWNEYGDHSIYRLEVVVRNEDYRQWLSYIAPKVPEWGCLEAAEHLIMSEEYRTAIWLYATRRMLYFRPKGKRKEVIDLADIISGEA